MGRLVHKAVGLYAVALASLIGAVALLPAITSADTDHRPADVLARAADGPPPHALTIHYPLDGAVFPPEIVPPTFRWDGGPATGDTWVISIRFQDGGEPVRALTRKPEWTPAPEPWEAIKSRSREQDADVRVVGVRGAAAGQLVSEGRLRFRTSRDAVGAPLFYREVNLPFIDAVKDPSHIRWRFGSISNPSPPIVLQGLPVCGNCHSFSSDGGMLAMDVDYANSKGSYVITPVAEEMTLATSNIITWNAYRSEDEEQTFGLLSQISPDGRYAVSTVKDKSVFVPKPGLEFSQLFFPIKGILCVYDRRRGTFTALPGADDPRLVQSNPMWSRDGRHIVFARTTAYNLKHTRGKGKVLLTREECKEFLEDGKPFRYDLYRIPFNGGKGGRPEPIPGASSNGTSNFFPKVSPDGNWIVFCKAKSYMLLQPDSELYVIPAKGGTARRLRCNTPRMNSWHSWSPNGKWLVFASKANGAYTQLWLTHMDDQARSTPPVLLAHLTAPDRAANIPEFVNADARAIRSVHEAFLDDHSFVRAGNELFRHGDADNAIQEYQNALDLNPNNAEARRQMGFLLYNVKKQYDQGMTHYRKALALTPDDPRIHHDLGMALLHQQQFHSAAAHLSRALRDMPTGLGEQYQPANIHYNLGLALCYDGHADPAVAHLSEAVRLEPDNGKRHYGLALALAAQGRIEETLRHYAKALSLNRDIDRWPMFHHMLAAAYAKQERFSEAAQEERRALEMARRTGNTRLVREFEQQLRALLHARDQANRPGF